MISDAYKTMIGVVLINLGTSFFGDWGAFSLYVFSYFHYKGAPFAMNSTTNSIILVVTIIPIIIAFILSNKIALKVGYTKLIKISALGYALSPLVTFIHFNFFIFFLFMMLIPSIFFIFSFVSTFSCIYSHFGKGKSLATAILLGSFSIGAMTWNLIVTLAINPENKTPNVPTDNPNFSYFSEEVAMRVPTIYHLIYSFSGAIFISVLCLFPSTKTMLTMELILYRESKKIKNWNNNHNIYSKRKEEKTNL